MATIPPVTTAAALSPDGPGNHTEQSQEGKGADAGHDPLSMFPLKSHQQAESQSYAQGDEEGSGHGRRRLQGWRLVLGSQETLTPASFRWTGTERVPFRRCGMVPLRESACRGPGIRNRTSEPTGCSRPRTRTERIGRGERERCGETGVRRPSARSRHTRKGFHRGPCRYYLPLP